MSRQSRAGRLWNPDAVWHAPPGTTRRLSSHHQQPHGTARRDRRARRATKPCIVTLHSDSTYVVKAMRLCWPQIWRDRGWRKKDRLPIANQDLWLRMLEVVGQHTVTWHWLKGHAGHAENERCDALANQAARGSELSIDQCYEEKVL